MALVGAGIGVLIAYLPNAVGGGGGGGGENMFATEAGTGIFFDDFASTYDVLNWVISLGFDTSWRRATVDAALGGTGGGGTLLDVGTGTGAIIGLALRHHNPPSEAVGLDPSQEMLLRARDKVSSNRARFVQGVAEAIPFEWGRFDVTVTSFGVRNFRARAKGLGEMYRVLAPGGTLVVLEVGPANEARVLSFARNFFVEHVMPTVAAALSGHPWAYTYLAKSMASFPGPEDFKQMLRKTGCVDVRHKRLAPMGLGPDLFVCTKPASATQE